MTVRRARSVRALALAVLLGGAAPPVSAQPPAPAPVTHVLATLTVPAAADRARLTALLPEEVRATVRLYLDGKIQQWYGRADNRGVMFILNAASIADARALVEELPLAKAGSPRSNTPR